MPNLRSQSFTTDAISLVASDGRSVTLTRAEIIAHFQGETGGKPARIAATIAWVKQQIEDALGIEQVPASIIDFDFDDVQGLKHLGFGSL